MSIQKKVANQVLSKLDAIANHIDSLAKSGKVSAKIASDLVLEIDGFADRFEIAAYGEGNLLRRQAKVIKRDQDEPYMDTFNNTVKPIKTDEDEEFMHKVGPSVHSKGMDTFDADRSSAVSDRDEYNVREVSEVTDGTKKQPSWARGPAGKSTKTASSKTWAR